MRLPGVGAYIGNAVLCFAYGKDLAVLDTNVVRVFSRFFGINSKKARPRTDPTLWKTAQELVPPRRSRAYNWALLDFAASVCTSRSPQCHKCPLYRHCKWPEKRRALYAMLSFERRRRARAATLA